MIRAIRDGTSPPPRPGGCWVTCVCGVEVGQHVEAAGTCPAGGRPIPHRRSLLRKALHAAGGRFRLHRQIAKGCTPDIVLPGRRLAVFVDGCFWHGCPTHGRKTPWTGPNAELWEEKMRRNAERDQRSTSLAEEPDGRSSGSGSARSTMTPRGSLKIFSRDRASVRVKFAASAEPRVILRSLGRVHVRRPLLRVHPVPKR